MSSALPLGTVIGGVTVGDTLGRGGFGITYRAEDNKSGIVYALKEYFPVEFAQRQRGGTVEPRPDRGDAFHLGLNAFLDEAHILRQLPRQRGLVRVRGAFERLGTAYCLMEFVDGEPLDRVLAGYFRRRRAVPEELIVEFLVALSSALAAVHAKGLIHRDIKPANVMIRSSDHQPVLIDFGAARQVAHDGAGVTMLTREYAPIEQFPLDWDSLGISHRQGPWSDIFSLSVLLYRLMSHRLPINAEERMLVRDGSGSDPYRPVAQAVADANLGANYSRRLCDLVDYGCSLFPGDRPADAAAFAALLGSTAPRDRGPLKTHMYFGQADEAGPAEVPADAAGKTALSTEPPPKRRRWPAVLAVLLVFVATGLAVAWSEGMLP